MAEYIGCLHTFSKKYLYVYLQVIVSSVYDVDIKLVIGELLVQFTNRLFLNTLFNAFRKHLFVIINWGTGSCRSHGVINLVCAHLCRGSMIEHFVVLGSMSLEGFLLNNAKELVGHLEKDWNSTFLEVEIEDVILAADLLFRIGRAWLKRLSWRILVLCGWRTTLLLLSNIWGILDELVDINVKLEELLPNEIFDKLIIVNQFFIIHLGSTFQLHLLGIILPFNFDLDEGVTN